MRRRAALLTASVLAVALVAIAVEELEYEVVSIDPTTWTVSARETASGTMVKFKMPPAVFKDKTFAADLGGRGAGQRFSATAPRNARMSNLKLESAPPPGPPGRTSPRAAPPPPGRAAPPPPAAGGYRILTVDNSWAVTARDTASGETIRFRVDPKAFEGYRFRASLRGLSRGAAFSLVAPNHRPIADCCTLMAAPGR